MAAEENEFRVVYHERAASMMDAAIDEFVFIRQVTLMTTDKD